MADKQLESLLEELGGNLRDAWLDAQRAWPRFPPEQEEAMRYFILMLGKARAEFEAIRRAYIEGANNEQ